MDSGSEDADTDTSSTIVDLNPNETFEDGDEPVEYTYEGNSFESPWVYSKADNASRSYPILVVGMWGEGEGYYDDVAQKYPSFVIEYQKSGTSDGLALAQWIQGAVDEGYRIDTSRIYYTGYSYGGSSSYRIAQGLYS